MFWSDSSYWYLLHAIICYFQLTQAWKVHTFPPSEQLQNRKGGENLLVVCSLEGLKFGTHHEIAIEWFKEGSPKPIGRLGRVMTLTKGKVLSKQLMFVKPTVEDSGLYKCIATALDGETQQRILNISFIKAAEFVDVQREQHPEEGHDALIVCRVSGDPSLEIFWQFNGNNIAEGGPRGYEFRENNQLLFIPKFEAEHDDGEYLCNAAQFSSFETISINVTAYARPQITVFDGPEKGRAYEGHSAQIQCQAVGKPKPHYKWFKKTDSEKEEEITGSDKYAVNGGLLVIHSLISADAGLYSCIASNALDDQRLDYNLTIFRKPRIEKMENLTRERGDTVDLRCLFSGDGQIHAKWLHQGEEWSVPVVPDSSILFTSEDYATQTHQTVKNNDADSSYEDNELESTDLVDEEFRRHRRQDQRISIHQAEGSLTLQIQMLGEDDAGLYQCVAENEAGTDHRSTFLAITHEPTITGHSDTERALAGSRLELSCEASAVPDPTWTWNGPEGLIEADGTKRIIQTEKTSTKLIISSTGIADYGQYTCIADNGIGSPVRATIEVIQIFIPDIPTEVNCHEHIYPNFATCKVDGFDKTANGHRPTELIFYYAKDIEVDSAYDWETQAKNVTLPFDIGTELKLDSLEPKNRYLVRVKASNEAGISDFSEEDFIETTDPWAPETPEIVRSDCSTICSLSWKRPNDHGSPITAYRVFIHEVLSEHPKELSADVNELFLQPDETNVQLALLKPLSTYEIRLVAVNDVGNSHPFTVMLNTPEYTVEDHRMDMNGSSMRIIIAVGFVLLFVLLVIDLICFAMNRCGLLACFCINCLGRNIHTIKGKDIEQSGKSSESNRLLKEAKTDVTIPTSKDEKNGSVSGGPQSTSV